MFQFSGFPSYTYVFSAGYTVLHRVGFPIRISAGHCLFPANRGFSQVVASFFGSWCQGIHLMLFFAWTASSCSLKICFFCLSSQIIVWVVNLTCLHCFLYVAISGSIVVFPLFRKDLLVLTFANLKNLSIYNYLCFFLLFLIRFSMNICLHTVSGTSTLVGSSGLEPPTSRLSGGCSNRLSYQSEQKAL